jgi:hypothetical protein
MDPREGVQEGEETYALLKRTPSRTTRSNAGVLTVGSPSTLAWPSPQSSANRNRMFGFGGGISAAAGPVAQARAAAMMKVWVVRFLGAMD